MSTTTNLDTLKINYLTQAQYETALDGGQINENEIYLTPSSDSGGTSVPTANSTAKFDAAAHMNSTDMTSSEVTSFLADINAQGTPSEYKKLLWTNPSPTASFAAQTILSDVDLTEYDEVEIYVRRTSSETGVVQVAQASTSYGASIGGIYGADTLFRKATVSVSGIQFTDGYYNGSVNNAYMIPYKIYGIKYEKVAPIQVDASDYVVEQGTSDIWTYRKWNSGIAECWGTATHSVTSWSSWYGWFYSEPYNISHDYPTNLFNAAPTLTVTWGSGVVGLPLGEGSSTKDRTGYWYIIRPSSATGSYSLCFHAIGKWK